MSTIADLERDVNRELQAIADYIGELAELTAQGAILFSDLDEAALRQLQGVVEELKAANSLRKIYAASLEGSFDDPELVAQLAIQELASQGLSAVLIEIFQQNARDAVSGPPSVKTQVVADLLAGATVETVLGIAEIAEQQLSDLVDDALNDFVNNPIESAGVRAVAPALELLVSFADSDTLAALTDDTELNDPITTTYSELLLGAVQVVNANALNVVERLTESPFSFLSALLPQTVSSEVRQSYAKVNDTFLRLDLDELRSEEITGARQFTDAFEDLVGDFAFDELIATFGSDVPGLAQLSIAITDTIPQLGSVLFSARNDVENLLRAGGDGASFIIAGTEDKVRGASSNDIVFGGQNIETRGGDDIIVLTNSVAGAIAFGNGGNDLIYGSDNADGVLDGGGGDDIIFGNGGNDAIRGRGGSDTIDGGEGFDTVFYDTATASIEITYDVVMDALTGRRGQAAGDVITNVEGIFGTQQSDVLLGFDIEASEFFLPDGTPLPGFTFNGSGGNDQMTVADGRYFFDGGDGEDKLLVDWGLVENRDSANFIFFTGGAGRDIIEIVGRNPAAIDETYKINAIFISVLDGSAEDRLVVGGKTATLGPTLVSEWDISSSFEGTTYSYRGRGTDTPDPSLSDGFFYTVSIDQNGTTLRIVDVDFSNDGGPFPASFAVVINDFENGDFGIQLPNFPVLLPVQQIAPQFTYQTIMSDDISDKNGDIILNELIEVDSFQFEELPSAVSDFQEILPNDYQETQLTSAGPNEPLMAQDDVQYNWLPETFDDTVFGFA
ncbi:MAG: calcium-binding protein [Pseudomonadota bacterium]